MGATYDEAGNDYAIGLGLLCITALVAFVFVLLRRGEALAALASNGHSESSAKRPGPHFG